MAIDPKEHDADAGDALQMAAGDATESSESRASGRSPTHAYLKEIALIPLLDSRSEAALAERVRAGDAEARRRMIESNLRLVATVARPFAGRGMPLMDLIAEGNLGLIRAVEKFDPARRLRFSTYAVWWIREAVQAAIMHHGRTVRVPVHVLRELAQMLRAERELAAKIGAAPSLDQIAAAIGKSAHDVAELFRINERAGSLDVAVEAGERALIGYIHDADESQGATESSISSDALQAWISALGERQRIVLQRRFGLDGTPLQTLAEIGRDLGISRERARQIQEDALKRLRTLSQTASDA